MATVSLTALDKGQIQSQPYGTIFQLQVGVFNPDNAYPLGGWSVSATQWGMQQVIGMIPLSTSGTQGITFAFDRNSTTLKALQTITATTGQLVETTSATAASMLPQFLVVGF